MTKGKDKNEVFGSIYLVTNNLNNKCYVGQTTKSILKRWQGHNSTARCGGKTLFCKAIRKYGTENFTIITLAIAGSFDELNTLETFFIKKLNTVKPFGYNLDLGGGNSWRHPDIGKKISKALKGKPSPRKGTKCSEESKRKMSKAQKGKIPWNKDKKFSEESKRKMSISSTGIKGTPHTKEFKENLSKRNIGNKYGLGCKKSLEEKKKMKIFANKRLRDEKGKFINIKK